MNEGVLVYFPLDKPHQHEHSLSTHFLFPSHCIRPSKEKRLGTPGLGNTSDVSSLPHTQVLNTFVGGVEGCVANPSAPCSYKGKWVKNRMLNPCRTENKPHRGAEECISSKFSTQGHLYLCALLQTQTGIVWRCQYTPCCSSYFYAVLHLLEELVLEKHFALDFVQLTQFQQSLFVGEKRTHEELTGFLKLEQLFDYTPFIFVVNYFNWTTF